MVIMIDTQAPSLLKPANTAGSVTNIPPLKNIERGITSEKSDSKVLTFSPTCHVGYACDDFPNLPAVYGSSKTKNWTKAERPNGQRVGNRFRIGRVGDSTSLG